MHFKEPKIERKKNPRLGASQSYRLEKTPTVLSDVFVVSGDDDKQNELFCKLNGIEYVKQEIDNE